MNKNSTYDRPQYRLELYYFSQPYSLPIQYKFINFVKGEKSDKIVNSPEIKKFIREHAALFWYTPEDQKEDISLDLLVETILNYGDAQSVSRLISILSIKETSRIFFNASGRKKQNYYPEIYNYFSLFFKRYA